MTPTNLTEISDTRLLILIREGNELAFHQIYNRYWKQLYAYTLNILEDKGLTEDTIQEVFIKIWTNRETTQIERLKNYLFNAVRNNALLKIRDNKFSSLNEQIISTLSLNSEAEQNLNLEDLTFLIKDAASNLPEKRREIFLMSRLQNYSITEIADFFNISHRSVENQLYLASKELRSTLGKSLHFLVLFWNI
ncbi:RNA polymerase sigma factor [Zobellia galactanivorans]|uniref:RNA polymerase ECF-type sigma factor n=1 Tax=Zobellia galactanivorans (strain DSM 12802 / CCUG 47099 / CIP 106680 / NCIMB 13871 / Dsij) TaxID=63186 RepID=G0LA50_ZOBGA|nr:RNA polymerase sigma-70 factor [Zobellia galactanivorans]CAZ95051.1 RNA polymerase ECF-type sigma factor [Zobellia galactanivorans]